ncbi:MAG: ABC transporter substrate-binding protein [Oscillospiraceae bacterium]
MIKRFWAIFTAAVVFLTACICLTSCKPKTLLYKITAAGTLTADGTVNFAGYSFNVYKDLASNPCGDCADQPPHLYIGGTAQDVIVNIKAVIEKADDLWSVRESGADYLILAEKQAGSVVSLGTLSAPDGITLTGTLLQGKASTDNAGTKTAAVRIPENPSRLAALYGPSYEALTVLGAESKIVLRADVQTENLPWAAVVFGRIESVAQLDNVHTAVSAEEALNYAPDLVFTFPRQNELDQFAALGIAAFSSAAPKTLSETKTQLADYANALGADAQQKARDYAHYFDEKLAMIKAVTDQLPESERPRVYYAGSDILTTYGKDSDITEVIAAAGGRSVSADLNAGNRAQVNCEQLTAWNPDWIFIDHGGVNGGKTVAQIKAQLLADNRYAGVAAVQGSHVVLTPSGVFYWDMGLQKILLVLYMAKTLHPDLFASLDLNAEVRNFYQTFYHYNLTQEQAQKILDCENP